MSQETWNVMFLVIRYVVVALILAYLAKVYVKRKTIHTDIEGRVLEWRVEGPGDRYLFHGITKSVIINS